MQLLHRYPVRLLPRIGFDRPDEVHPGVGFSDFDPLLQGASRLSICLVASEDLFFVTEPSTADTLEPPASLNVLCPQLCDFRDPAVSDPILSSTEHGARHRRITCFSAQASQRGSHNNYPLEHLAVSIFDPLSWWRAAGFHSPDATGLSRGHYLRPHLYKYIEVVRESLNPLGHSPALRPVEARCGAPYNIDNGTPPPRHAYASRAPVK